MRGELRRFVYKGLLMLVFVWGMSLASSMDVQAALKIGAVLTVEDKYFVQDGVVKETFISDGKGGTITYDEAKNTLTIDNYTFTKLGRNDTFIDSYLMSGYQTFRIVLKGTSTMVRAEDKREWSGKVECFSLRLDNDATIEGDGKLIANTAPILKPPTEIELDTIPNKNSPVMVSPLCSMVSG